MIAIAPTDADWLAFLRQHPEIRKVNFWTPTPWNFGSLGLGEYFYFLQKGPEPRKIAGYGRFAYYENLTARKAWEKYGLANGVQSFAELVDRVDRIAGKGFCNVRRATDPEIGCIILGETMFLKLRYRQTPAFFGLNFPRQVVKFKTFPCEKLDFPSPPATAKAEPNF
jgi:putative restriction endonuclease